MGYRELHVLKYMNTKHVLHLAKDLKILAILRISTCLETPRTARNNKFQCSIVHLMNLVHVQPDPQVLKVATAMKIDRGLQGSWSILSMYALQKQLQRRHRQWHLKIDTFTRGLDGHFSVNRKQYRVCHLWYIRYVRVPLLLSECLCNFLSMYEFSNFICCLMIANLPSHLVYMYTMCMCSQPMLQ